METGHDSKIRTAFKETNTYTELYEKLNLFRQSLLCPQINLAKCMMTSLLRTTNKQQASSCDTSVIFSDMWAMYIVPKFPL